MAELVFVTFVRLIDGRKESFVSKDVQTIIGVVGGYEQRSYARIRYDPDQETIQSEATFPPDVVNPRLVPEIEKVKKGELAYVWLGSHD